MRWVLRSKPIAETKGERVRFSEFELDLRSGELWDGGGRRVLLPKQPFRILATLVRARGDIVTREQLRHELWPDDTFVDYEHGLNAAVKRLRETIRDSASAPRFIETLPRVGTDSSVGSRRSRVPGTVTRAARMTRPSRALPQLPLANSGRRTGLGRSAPPPPSRFC